MRWEYKIDIYNWHHWWLWLMPSHDWMLYHLDDCEPGPRSDIKHECGTGCPVGCRTSLGVEIRRNWGPTLRSKGNRSIEFRNSEPEEQWSIEHFFCLFLLFSSLLHNWLLHWISAWNKWRWQGLYHLGVSVNGRWRFPVGQTRRKATLSGTYRLWHIWVHTSTYVAGLFNPSFSLIFHFLLYTVCSPGGLRLKWGIL